MSEFSEAVKVCAERFGVPMAAKIVIKLLGLDADDSYPNHPGRKGGGSLPRSAVGAAHPASSSGETQQISAAAPEKAIAKQDKKEIQKGIRSLEKRIEQHAEKIKYPKKLYPDWDIMDSIYKDNVINKWKKEQENMQKSVENRKAALEGRKNKYGKQ